MASRRRAARVLALLWGGAFAALTAEKPFTAADIVAVRTIGEVQPSPDGKTIVFSVGASDLAANRTVNRLMRVVVSGGEPAPVKGALEGASSVRWSPDGRRIAFIASRDGERGIFTLDPRSGKLTRVCDYRRPNAYLARAGNALAWSPDGKWIAFAGTLEPDPPPQDPIVITRILYKTLTALSDNRRAHIYVAPAGGGRPRQLTSGDYDEHSIDWGGDGREIVFLSNREPDPDAKLNYDIFAVDVNSGDIRRITSTPGVEMEPRVSPDGAWIAYSATKRDLTTIDSVAEDAHAWAIPYGGGQARELNADLDRRTSAVQWSADGKRILYIAGDRGSNLICSTTLDAGATSCEIGRGAQAGALAAAGDGSLAFTMNAPDKPAELFHLAGGSSEPRQLTRVNEPFASERRLSKPEALSFRSFDGTPIEGWLYPAQGATGRAPLILTIHGGPHGAYGYSFSQQFQFFAAGGYAVLAINPRGSSGYGQKFSDGCVNDWGGGDYKDLMAGVDHALATHPEIDPERLFVTGGSYGGFMTNWVITQTQRFKAAVAVASLSNLISFYATSLYQDLVHAEFNGFPWADDNFATLWKWSPLAHVVKVATPTLFLHGENDNEVHITQGEEMYTALRQRGIEAALVRYPREGHGFGEPKHRVDAAERTVAWFNRWAAK
ncbi:MAG: S9 family peptidase [Bryobacteraceae bacterium]|nr:S9 family peptidase [Bryobacteraceae bacterium]